MGLFDIPSRNKLDSKSVLKKISNKKSSEPTMKLGKDSLLMKITNINTLVESKLGHLKDEYLLINTEEELHTYIDECIKNGICSFDTESTGLDTFNDKIVGFSLYTPQKKAIYVPINHISYITGIRCNNQLNEDIVSKELSRLKDIKIIYHNAKFDYKLCVNQLGITLPIYYDTMIVARLLNQKESAALKYQYATYIEKTDEKNSFGDLFDDVRFDYVPINTGYLYAAKDAQITYQLYEYQMKILQTQEMSKIKNVAFEIEFPIIDVVADMELNGITIDFDYANYLSEKYNQLLVEKEAECLKLLEQYKSEIESYKRLNPNHKLSEPFNIGSPTQMSILLYDILKQPVIDKRNPRGTGEEILLKINIPFTKAVLEYRGLYKLLSTYIDKLPAVVNTKTQRLHASFNQYGTDTGRFSSSDPNLQNIPSHNKEIRKMFRASEGMYLVGSDFSQQEPRLLSFLSGDKELQKAYQEGKDIYSWVASLAFHKPYEACKEFNPDGSKNPEGKELRTRIKAIVLGIMYSKTAPSIAEDLKISKEEAENIFNSFFKAFPTVEKFITDTQHNVAKIGYSETLFGRRRYLPDMMLEDYEITSSISKPRNFNPLFDEDDEELDFTITEEDKKYWIRKMEMARGLRAKQDIISLALQEGIIIKDNTSKKQDALRQCVNSVIQGSAADMTKVAFRKIKEEPRFKELGFKLLLTVHDEIIGECPKEHAKEAGELLGKTMATCLEDIVTVPFKCDAEITEQWYGETINI